MSHRILIVEDEALIAADLADALSEQGYAIAGIVGTGNEAIDAVAKTPVDLVLLDINLRGELDGIQAASSLPEPRPPVVFLTAHGDDGTLRRAESVEPAGYLVKPFEERTLYATVRMALYRSRAERERKARLAMVSSALDRIDRAVVRMVVQNSSFTLVSTGNRRVATGWLMAWHAVGDSASPAASVLSSVVLVTATAVSEAVSGVGAVSGAVSKGSGGGCGSLSCLPSGGDGLSGCCGKSSLCSSE